MSCKAFFVDDVSDATVKKIISGLEKSGAEIKGNNPWNIDLKQHGIKLKAEWSSNEQKLKIQVTDKDFIVPCKTIEKELKKRIDKVKEDSDAIS